MKLIILALTTFSLAAFEFQGQHFVASYYDCDEIALSDRSELANVLVDAAKSSGAQILDSCRYHFDGAGFTMIVLLSESHASIHTYPEHKACFVDLFTCGDACDHEQFHHVLATYLRPKRFSGDTLERK